MSHWAAAYLGQPWSDTCDCFYWFRRIQQEVFGRHIEDVHRAGNRLTFAARSLTEQTAGRFGWRRAVVPAEGDAVFLSQRGRPHHIGVASIMDGKLYVVHAPDGCGVVLSDAPALRVNLWRIISFWTPYGNQ